MSAEQGELCLGMIEAVDIAPGLYVVASLAAERSAVGAFAGHAIVEFALVRILMACRAGAVLKVEGQNLVGAAACAGLVTIIAGDGRVRAGEGEFGVAVLGDSERGAMPILDGVTRFAAIVVRGGGKLLIVGIFVAIGAICELHLINRIFAGGDVALGAIDFDVLAF